MNYLVFILICKFAYLKLEEVNVLPSRYTIDELIMNDKMNQQY